MSVAKPTSNLQQASRDYRYCENVTEFLIYAAVLFSPWALGSVRDWAIETMNKIEFALGFILFLKWMIRWRTGYAPARWNQNLSGRVNEGSNTKLQRWLTHSMVVFTLLVLLWSLISAINYRARFFALDSRFEFFDCVAWLPHAYDHVTALFYFWIYLGLALAFWSVRDWLLGKSKRERTEESLAEPSPQPSPQGRGSGASIAVFIPARLTRLLWILTINGAALAIVCILQRLSGSPKLLWLIKPLWNDASGVFGPFGYRANAAQYFNLVWPMALGFWWCVRSNYFRQTGRTARSGGGAHTFMLLLILVMILAPTLSLSRGGALVSYGALLASLLGLVRSRFGASLKNMLILLGCVLAVLGGMVYFGQRAISKRFATIKQVGDTTTMEERFDQYDRSYPMIRENRVFGVGPGCYWATYFLYKAPTDHWYPFAHSDWIQLMAEWGILGSALVIAGLLATLAQAFRSNAANDVLLHAGSVSLLATLVHALFDFPLWIHSVLFLFIVAMAILVSLPCRRVSSDSKK